MSAADRDATALSKSVNTSPSETPQLFATSCSLDSSGSTRPTRRSCSEAAATFAKEAPRNLSEAKATRTALFKPFHASMLAAGVHLPPSPYESWFVSTAHGVAEIEHVVSAAEGWARGRDSH